MATVPLSKLCHAFCGIHEGYIFDALTTVSVHPESPVLLTKNGPPEESVFQSEQTFIQATVHKQAHLKFDNL